MSEATDDGASIQPRPPIRPTQSPWRTRLKQALRLMATFVVVPMVVGIVLGPPGAGFATTLGAVQVLWSSLKNGRRTTRRLLPLLLAAAVLGSLAKPGWWWVVLLVALAAASGIATMRGAGVAVSMATLQAVIVPPVADTGRLLVLAGFLVFGAAYGWMMARKVGAPRESPAPLATRRQAFTIAIALSAAVGIAASIAVISGLQYAAWGVAAVVALGIPTPGLTEQRMLQRVLGQFAACGIVAVVAFISTSPIVLMTAAMICLLLFFMSFGRPLAEQIAYLSAFFMLPAVAATAPVTLIGQKIAFNLLGLAIIGAVLGVLRLLRTYQESEAAHAA